MKQEDLKFEACGHVPPGGQHVGVCDTGVKVTHLPTNISAYCNMERSQLKNKRVATAMVEYGLAELGWKD